MKVTGLYFIAILCPGYLSEKIRTIQVDVAEKYGSRHSLKSPPHITLLPPFKHDENTIAELAAGLRIFLKRFSVFGVELNGFNCFERNRVVFIRVIPNVKLDSLYRLLSEFSSSGASLTLQSPHAQFTPHITIASRDLNKEMFCKSWSEFKEKKINETFMVNSFFLLKHTGKEWVPFQEFRFVSG